MPTKISNATKRLALEKLRSGMTLKEVSDMTGVSVRSLQRWQTAQAPKSAKPASKATPAPAPAPTPDPVTQTGAAVDFEESPAPVADKQQSLVDKGFSSIKGLLGIKDKEEKPIQPLTAKLDPKRQQFVESVTPTLALGFIVLAGAVWFRIGPEYKLLAPDEEVARKVVEPLVRIYARHANFLTEVNPDWADAGASLFALIGYIHVSLTLYQKIKEEKEREDAINGNGAYRGYRAGAGAAGGENGASHQNGRHADVSGASQKDAGGPGTNGQYAGAVGSVSLTEKEQAQFAKLSLLAQRDFESRARRSGQF